MPASKVYRQRLEMRVERDTTQQFRSGAKKDPRLNFAGLDCRISDMRHTSY
jgi:hypothetical protein